MRRLLTIAVCCVSVSTFSQSRYLDISTIDSTVKAGDDFFNYANGRWLQQHEIPANEVVWGNWTMMENQTRARLLSLLHDVAKSKAPEGSNLKKLHDFYLSGIDIQSINQRGMQPLAASLKRIQAIGTIAQVMQEVFRQQASGMTTLSPLFELTDSPDPIDNLTQVLAFNQGGLGLPEKSYYIDKNTTMVNIRRDYFDYLKRVLKIAGAKPSEVSKMARDILLVEYHLANAARTTADNRDLAKTYNYFTVAQLRDRYPNLGLQKMIASQHISGNKFLVSQPEFFDSLNNLLVRTPVAVWKNYLLVKLVGNAAYYLADTVAKTHFAFYGTIVNGQPEMKSRSERIVREADQKMGEILGKLYVEKYFNADAKRRINELVSNVLTTFGERIRANTWMTDSTKIMAQKKLSTVLKKIGYPDKWRDYTGLKIGNQYYENILAASSFKFRQRMQRIGKPVDRMLWDISPPTLNAYYEPLNNEILFPAGILIYPFFEKDADDAVNYGGIGTVIGHEISHGFDDNGSLFDETGKFKNWWTDQDRAHFETLGKALATQFNQYNPVDTIHVNGQLTLGENIADLCGITVAYQAFKKTKQGQSTTKIDGFMPDQRFFLSYATIWREKQREADLRKQLVTDPHAPSLYRINGPLSNLDIFYRAFDVKPGDKLWRPANERVAIW